MSVTVIVPVTRVPLSPQELISIFSKAHSPLVISSLNFSSPPTERTRFTDAIARLSVAIPERIKLAPSRLLLI